MDFDVWRIVTNESFAVPSPQTIYGSWSLEDVIDAHLYLDEMAAEAKRSRKEADAARPKSPRATLGK